MVTNQIIPQVAEGISFLYLREVFSFKIDITEIKNKIIRLFENHLETINKKPAYS